MTDEKETNKSQIAQKEEEIQKFWEENQIFEKSLKQNEGKKHFVFYDGPPFANGLPHYGHLLPNTMKDVIPRYQTMKGKYVRRQWGWDCHGLPVETLVERELGLEHKKDIEKYGIEKFNEAAKKSVFRYDKEWKKIISRMGRWIDMENNYKTMNPEYTESVWWAFKKLHEKNLVFKDYKSMHICPRCETTLSTTEVADGYKDIKDISVTVKFELMDEPGTFVLAWTTTPWTLPGNVALAVGENIAYSKLKVKNEKSESNEYIIVAKDRLEEILKDKEYEIVEELKGKDLIGKSYKPAFYYFADKLDLENKENGWKIYGADFVTTESGTGIVHIAPAFGEEDMKLGKKYNLPFVQHVSFDGRFIKDVKDFVGMQVKPKDDHQIVDIEIIKHLAHTGLLFAKEKIMHSYPHCWRCDTPLLNYATSSWFIKVTAIKDKLIKGNKKINWIPEAIGSGRFHNWLEGARDWSISRTRFWGAPLPVWECEECDKREVLGSIEDIKNKTKSSNKFFVMRHGEAESNISHTVSDDPNDKNSLTEKGRNEVQKALSVIKKKNIDVIIASDLVRTKETAEIISEGLGIVKDSVIYDERLRELNAGEWGEGTWKKYRARFNSEKDRLNTAPPKGESGLDVKMRVGELLFELEKKHEGKNILFVSHGFPIAMFFAVNIGLTDEKIATRANLGEDFETADIRELPFAIYPHNENYELDFHGPYIDKITFPCTCGGEMKRIPEVFDCWVESGSMPFAQFHYPFENKKEFKKNFPADFIAEGLDQTRGWFYTMLVLSTGLFGEVPYKNVAVNGLILAEDGRKMSKKLKNYPEPMDVINRYSADALRYYLISSPAVHAEDLRFTEKGVDEIQKKILMRLLNVVSFYELYKDDDVGANVKSKNTLDIWVVARLKELVVQAEEGFDAYELDRAVRPIADFVDDLSTWYIRRSRDRFKSGDSKDKQNALSTLRFVLRELAKTIAPVMPFIAEDVYERVKSSSEKESVHLEVWPKVKIGKGDKEVIKEMKKTRELVSLALEERASIGIKVRQPLMMLRIKNQESRIGNREELVQLIKDEVNVKEVVYNSDIDEQIELDTTITPELQKEGNFRELIRGIQDLRKKENLIPSDTIVLSVETSEEGKEFIREFIEEIKHTTLTHDISFDKVESGTTLKAGEHIFKVSISR